MHALREMRVWGKQIKLSVIALVMAPVLAVMISLMTVAVKIESSNEALSPKDIFLGIVSSNTLWCYAVIFYVTYVAINTKDHTAWFNRNLYILFDVVASIFHKKLHMYLLSVFLMIVTGAAFLIAISRLSG